MYGRVTSLVRALALHGVARPPAGRMRSHLASPLRPGRGVLIRSVSRRLGSVAYVREDASPNEVSNLTNSRMPLPIPAVKPGQSGTSFTPRSNSVNPQVIQHFRARQLGQQAAGQPQLGAPDAGADH